MQLTLKLWQWRNIQMKIQVHLNYMATQRLFVHGNSKGQSKVKQSTAKATPKQQERTKTDLKESYLAFCTMYSVLNVECIQSE